MVFRATVCMQGNVTVSQPGRYTSFPSLVQDPATGQIVLLYRRGIYDESDPRPGMTAHGLDGSLFTRVFDVKTSSFGDETLLIDGAAYLPGLIDGNLTAIDGRVHLFARRYPHPTPVFYGHGPSIEDISDLVAVPVDPDFYMGAQWGRLISLDDGQTLLQAFYGGCVTVMNRGDFPKYYTRPALYHSTDAGKTWGLKSWITPEYVEGQVCANETTLLYANQRLFALMRTAGEMPGPLFLTFSDDLGATWSTPTRTGLYGEAPMFYQDPDGQVWLAFRGYREEAPLEGGNISITRFDAVEMRFDPPHVIETYLGNHYDGGYGDMIWLPETRQLLICYYYSDQPTPRNPWIRYALLAFDTP
jgi:hypothetical protein